MSNLGDGWVERKNQLVGLRFENKDGHKYEVLNYYRNSTKELKKFKIRFDYYLKDLPLIDGFDLELYDKGELVLDKDIKFKGNKLYSLENCMFVTIAENTKFSVKRTDGRSIKVHNLKTNDFESYRSISAFCRKYKLDRHMVVKNANTKVEYKNFLIYLEEC